MFRICFIPKALEAGSLLLNKKESGWRIYTYIFSNLAFGSQPKYKSLLEFPKDWAFRVSIGNEVPYLWGWNQQMLSKCFCFLSSAHKMSWLKSHQGKHCRSIAYSTTLLPLKLPHKKINCLLIVSERNTRRVISNNWTA